MRPSTHDHTRRTLASPAQLDLVGTTVYHLKPEGRRKRLGARQVRLLELQPGDVDGLDHGISRPAWVFAGKRPLLTVQVAVPAAGLNHKPSQVTDEIVTY